MNIINIATKIGNKYTKNGCKLLSKETFASSILPKNIRPKECNSVEIVKVETNFGKSTSTVLSLKDSNGKLIRKVLTKKADNKETFKLIRDYKRDKNVLFTDTKYIENGHNTHNESEIFRPYDFGVLNEPKTIKGMNHIKLSMRNLSKGRRYEEQVYSDTYANSKPHKYLKTTAIRQKNGLITDKTLYTPDEYAYEQFKNDPYLYIRNYNMKDFMQSASHYAAQKQGVKRGLYIERKILGSEDAFYHPWFNSVTCDSRKAEIKSCAVDTLNHEYRHKWQASLRNKYIKSLFGGIFNKFNLTKSDKDLARKFLKAEIIYPAGKIKEQLYWDNFLEIDARNIGEKAKDEYRIYSKKLADYFDLPDTAVYTEHSLDTLLKEILNSKKTKTINIGLFEAASKPQ